MFAADTARGASAHCHLADAMLFAVSQSLEIVIAGTPGAPDTEALLAAARRPYLPQSVVLLVPPGDDGRVVRTLAPFTAGHVPIDGSAAAYVCRDFACRLPVTDAASLVSPPLCAFGRV